MRRFIKVTDPLSGKPTMLEIKPINNAPYPGWLVLISCNRNIWIYRQQGNWKTYPDVISREFTRAIAFQLQNGLLMEDVGDETSSVIKKGKVTRPKPFR